MAVNSSTLRGTELPNAISENERPFNTTPSRTKSLAENARSVLKKKFSSMKNKKTYCLAERRKYFGVTSFRNVTTRLPQVHGRRGNTTIPHDTSCINMVSFKVHSNTNPRNFTNCEEVENSNGETVSSTPIANPSTDLICRICHEEDAEGSFISPCKCSGTLGLVHKSCLEKWLTGQERRQNRCELCHTDIPVERKPRPFYKYFSGNRKRLRGLYIDLFFIFFWIPLVALSGIYYAKLIPGVSENRKKTSISFSVGKPSNHSIYLGEGFKNGLEDDVEDVSATALVHLFAFFNCVVKAIMIIWIIVSLWENVKDFLKWRKECCEVRVCLPEM